MTSQEIKQKIEETKNLIATIQNKIADLQSKQGKERPEEKTEDELQEIQYRSAAAALMEKDPTKALELLNKADTLRERINSRSRELSPDQARQQLRIARDNARNVVSSTSDQIDKNTRDLAALEVLIYSAEMAKPNPNVQIANQKVDELYRTYFGGTSGVGTSGSSSEITDLDSAYKLINSKLANIEYKGKDLDAVVSELEQLINASKTLAPADAKKAIDSLKEQAEKKPNAPTKKVETEKNYKIWKEGFEKSGQMKGWAAGIALGQAMNKTIGSYKDSDNVSQGDIQQLAALVYQTYNPGTLSNGEMGSAVAAAKGGGYSNAVGQWFKNKFGITNLDYMTGAQAKSIFNKALNQSITAYKETQSSLESRRKIEGPLNLTDLYLKSFSNPSNYLVVDSGSSGMKNDSGYPKVNSESVRDGKDLSGKLLIAGKKYQMPSGNVKTAKLVNKAWKFE